MQVWRPGLSASHVQVPPWVGCISEQQSENHHRAGGRAWQWGERAKIPTQYLQTTGHTGSAGPDNCCQVTSVLVIRNL